MYNKLNSKVNNLENSLTHINHIKRNLENIIGDVAKNIPEVSGLVTTTVLNTKRGEV